MSNKKRELTKEEKEYRYRQEEQRKVSQHNIDEQQRLREMKMHDSIQLFGSSETDVIVITRVYGGWVYLFKQYGNTIFVPM